MPFEVGAIDLNWLRVLSGARAVRVNRPYLWQFRACASALAIWHCHEQYFACFGARGWLVDSCSAEGQKTAFAFPAASYLLSW